MSSMEDADTDTITKTKVSVPKLYNVVLLNDDFTPMDFVIQILMELFSKAEHDAMTVMLEIHHNGQGVAGTYSQEIAETKVNETMKFAGSRKHPLMAKMTEAGPV